MTIWQKNLDEIHIEDSPGDVQVATTDTRDEPIFSAPGLDDTVSPTQSEDSGVPQDLSIGDTSMYVPAEEQFPRILPGDIVYIPQETNKQLSYKKGIYLGRSKDNKHTARDWNTRSDVEVSLTTLVRKTDCTTEEKEEAALLRAHQTPGTGDAHPRYYLKKHLLSVEACYTLLSEALQLAHGTREITGYDESLIKPIFSDFAQRFSGRSLENGVKLEDIVRMFYAIATSEQSKDATTSDAMWKAHVERSAALLTDVLIEVVEGQYDVNTAVVAQLRAEQAQMVGRANEAVKLASGSYFRQSFTDRQTTYDDAEGNQLEIDSVTFKSLKLRVHDVATGQEQLLGFGDDDIKRTFQAFSQFLDASPLAGTSLVEEIVRDFRRCALFELNMDETLSRTQRNTMVRRQEALLLSLLISVDAQVQLELHGSAPRIRSRFTTILMEERARLSFSASRSEALSSRHDEQTEEDAAEIRPHGPDPSTLVSRLSAQVDGPDVAIDEQDSSQGRVLHTEDAAMERPPRVLRCYSCQHIWISTLAADLRECPECGSYSVFAESPRRTASPDNADFSHHAVAPGEAALGQYFSERTDKYMNLYRREQPRLRSTTDSHESLPNPWGHLQNSSNTSLAKAGRTPPKEPQTDPLAKICYTCRHRFARPADRDEGKCPKCGSEFVFTDKSWDTTFRVSATDAPKTDQPRSLLHPLGIAPLQLSNLILDIEDVAAKLQGLQDRHSNNTRDVPEAVDQFLCLSTGFRRLAKLQEDPEYELRFHRVQETVQILCSSIQYTVAVLLNTLRSPLDETQWMKLCASMQNVEKINILERLRWYQASILGLLDHLDGFTSESLLGMDANIRSLLERQRNVRRSDPVDELSKASGTQREMLPEASTSTSCYACHAQLPDWSAVSKADACPNCGSWFMSNPSTPPRDNEIQEVKPAEPDTESESKDLVQAEHQASISQQLTRLIDDTEHAMTRLQRFQDQNYGNATGITEIIDEMLSLRNSFRKLSQLCADPNYDPNFVKVQEPIQTLCRSMQHTLNAMLEVLTAEAEANETAWTTWVMLSIRMAGAEQVGLPERLKWYSASILGLLNHLDGFPSAGRIFSWLGMDEKVRSLLERQEAVAQEAELAKQNKEVDTPEPAPFREEDATSEKLICIIRDCGEVATGLQELEAGHSRQSARIHECMNQVLDLRESLEQLYSLRNDPLNWSSLSKKEQPIRKTCHSIKYTLDDLLEALNAGTEDEKWKRWGELNVRMVEAEKFILSGRLIWYEGIVSAILGGFDKFLDGAWNFQWEIVEEPMRELLERQRSVRSER
jgi:rRNA maturation endonuclease Nob1